MAVGTEQLRNGKRNFSQPLWLGADAIAGKTILLHAEQGLGDTIQFAHYAPLVAARGARVVLEVQRPLRELMRSLSDTVQIVAVGEPLPDFDLQCPLLSLPLAFKTRLETIPAQIPYLSATADKTRACRRCGSHDPIAALLARLRRRVCFNQNSAKYVEHRWGERAMSRQDPTNE
jgi:hypothetical protein